MNTGSIPGTGRYHMPQSNYAHCHNYWVYMLQPLKPMSLGLVLPNKKSHCNEKAAHSQLPLLIQGWRARNLGTRPPASTRKTKRGYARPLCETCIHVVPGTAAETEYIEQKDYTVETRDELCSKHLPTSGPHTEEGKETCLYFCLYLAFKAVLEFRIQLCY